MSEGMFDLTLINKKGIAMKKLRLPLSLLSALFLNTAFAGDPLLCHEQWKACQGNASETDSAGNKGPCANGPSLDCQKALNDCLVAYSRCLV